MHEFFYSANLYGAIDKIVHSRTGNIEDSPYFNDALGALYDEYTSMKARNILIGPLNRDLKEFDIGFLTKRPFNGNVDCNPAIKHLQEKYELSREKLEENYNTGLMMGRNSLGTQIKNFNICSYFPVNLKNDAVIARCLKWSKNDISLSMFFAPDEYNDTVKTPEYTKSVCRLDHMKVFKVLMHKVEMIENGQMPYFDELYDSL